MNLSGKTAFVSGAGRGIGRATALALAQAGADVAINDLQDGPEVAAVLAEIQKFGRKALLFKGDVTDLTFVEASIASLANSWGHLDLAVSNAAFSDREPFHLANLDGFRRTVDVTMWGAFNLLRAATRQMISQGHGGAIAIVSSPHAVIPVPNAMAYNMSKAAIDHMARTAAIELAEHRIRVNLVHPGWIDTPGERKFTAEPQIQQAASGLPWGRLGQPEEIARAIVFLCSPESDYITGSTLTIDGGISLPWWGSPRSAAPNPDS